MPNCPNDTNGDGDCGMPGCLYCSPRIPPERKLHYVDKWEDSLTGEPCQLIGEPPDVEGRQMFLRVSGQVVNSMTSFDYLARRIEHLRHIVNQTVLDRAL